MFSILYFHMRRGSESHVSASEQHIGTDVRSWPIGRVWAVPVPQLRAQAQKQELLPALSVVITVQHLAKEAIFTVENNIILSNYSLYIVLS